MKAAFQVQQGPVPEMPEVWSFQIHGIVNYRNAPELRTALLASIRELSTSRLVIELSGVSQMDTAAAAVLVEALMVSREEGKLALICAPSDAVLRLFRLGGLGEVLHCCCEGPADLQERFEAVGARG
ncbi:MAG: STAS domain-containing protein [Acidobacteriota bacterium]